MSPSNPETSMDHDFFLAGRLADIGYAVPQIFQSSMVKEFFGHKYRDQMCRDYYSEIAAEYFLSDGRSMPTHRRIVPGSYRSRLLDDLSVPDPDGRVRVPGPDALYFLDEQRDREHMKRIRLVVTDQLKRERGSGLDGLIRVSIPMLLNLKDYLSGAWRPSSETPATPHCGGVFERPLQTPDGARLAVSIQRDKRRWALGVFDPIFGLIHRDGRCVWYDFGVLAVLIPGIHYYTLCRSESDVDFGKTFLASFLDILADTFERNASAMRL